MPLMIKSDKDGELTIAFSNMEHTGYLWKSSFRGMFGTKTHNRNFLINWKRETGGILKFYYEGR